jgi:hypothetical protein
MIMDVDMARKFGQMESRLDSVEQTIERMDQRSRRLEEKMDIVVQKLASNAGGTKMLVALLTLSATVGGVFINLVGRVWEMVVR